MLLLEIVYFVAACMIIIIIMIIISQLYTQPNGIENVCVCVSQQRRAMSNAFAWHPTESQCFSPLLVFGRKWSPSLFCLSSRRRCGLWFKNSAQVAKFTKKSSEEDTELAAQARRKLRRRASASAAYRLINWSH